MAWVRFRLGAICGLSLLLVLARVQSPAAGVSVRPRSYGWRLSLVLVLLRGFFSAFSGFSSSTKTNIFKFQFDQDRESSRKPAKADMTSSPNIVIYYQLFCSSQFIQPQGQAPKTTLTLVIPPMDVNFLCPLTFYLRQNLSQLLFSPRYMDSDPSHHFKAVSGSKTEATGCANGERLQPEIYLYNRPHSSGGKGVRSR